MIHRRDAMLRLGTAGLGALGQDGLGDVGGGGDRAGRAMIFASQSEICNLNSAGENRLQISDFSETLQR